MTPNIFRILSPFMLIVWIILAPSCKDEMNAHYKETSLGTGSNLRIAEYIQAQPELSKFYQMLKISGYDTILNASQTYTVWAPVDNALQNVDLNDTSLVSDIVMNHIAHFSYTTSGLQSIYVRMVNGKLIHFYSEDTSYLLGKCYLTNYNLIVNNGLVHMLNNYISFQPNIWEYITRTQGLDSLKDYVNSLNYDSGYISSNLLLDNLGALSTEDSIYTCILPDNTAWNEAYDRIKTYYVSTTPTVQRKFTKSTIVKDMAFRNRIFTGTSLDSLVSTNGNVFLHPDYLFTGATQNEVSNGLVYVTSQMQYKASESWHKEIRVEAEITGNRAYASNSVIYLRNSNGSSFNVSNRSYIVAEPTTTSTLSKVYVDFYIPSILSAKYNIYCVFVPSSIADSSDHKPFRAIFSIIYPGVTKYQTLTVTNNVTDPNGITKMLIASDFKFPYCDMNTTPVTKLRVQNNVTTDPMDSLLSRSMRIDCLILEPVAQ